VDFIFFIIAWLVGSFVGALTLGQCLIIFRFGLPTAIRWYRLGWLIAARPVTRYLMSFVFLAGLFLGITWIMLQFFSSHAIGYFIGLGMAMLYTLGRSGATSDNITDFIQANQKYINQLALDKLKNKEPGL